jgi:aminopeptidase N
MRDDEARLIRLEDYRVPDFLIDTVELGFELAPERTRVRSRLGIRRNPKSEHASAPLVLDGEDLTLLSLALDGSPLAADGYRLDERTLTIADVPTGPFRLEIETEVNPSANTALMGLYRSNGIYCTQCEAEGFRRITFFLDRPDVLSVYTTRVEAPRSEAPVLLGNGNLVAQGAVPDSDRHFAVWHDPFPKPCYLFALVGGELAHIEDQFTTRSGHEVLLGIYAEPGKEDRLGYAMEALKRAMRFDEEAFGREYDLERFNIVAVSDFNMGAMENKGLNIFNDKYVLASAETATDQDYANIEAIIAHEYFHNWSGNRITCRDWFQLCLKEGLTVFRDQEFTAAVRSAPVKRIEDVRRLRAQQFAEDAGPLAHPVRPRAYREINNFYTATVYEKGAELVRMLRTLVGADAFDRGMTLYFERCDGMAATVEDFLSAMAQASGRDLSHFAQWYEQAGTPEIIVTTGYDAGTERFEMSFEQAIPPTPDSADKLPLPVPIRLGLVARDGRDLPLVGNALAGGSDVFVLDRAQASITFECIPERPVPSLLRGFSAPVRLKADLSAADRLHLLAHDGDPVNRWQAAQDVALEFLLALARDDGASGRDIDAFADALGQAVSTAALDPAFRALLLALPSEADIAREMRRDVDPEAVHHARTRFQAGVARRIAQPLRRLYDEFRQDPFSTEATSVGRRALKNAALELLCAHEGLGGVALAQAQFEGATNMTDRMAALTPLVLAGPSPARDAALAHYLAHFEHDPLALDKWFTVQAIAYDDDTLDRVRHLTDHPRFSFGNPNRVRALVGAFATGNQRGFHRPDGAGYAFLADTVLSLDKRNPQLAARLAQAFRSWRMLTPNRAERARSALQRMAEQEGLSIDLRDVLIRSLDGLNKG